MKLKVLILLVITIVTAQFSLAQRGGAKIAYVDTDYILSNINEYQTAQEQLSAKVLKWKVEVEQKLNVINQQREALNNEKALLTPELYEERLEDLSFEEKEIIAYQQKRFGPQGDLILQRKQLMQPLQDQIFQAVQDLVAKRKYDLVFDKSGDVVMLYSAEKYDISDQVLRVLNRASKRKQATTKAERREADKDDVIEEELSESQLERQRILEARKSKRDSTVAARKEQLRLEREAQIQAKKDEREAAKKALQESRNKNKKETKTEEIEGADTAPGIPKPKTKEELLQEKRNARLENRAKRAKALEDKRKADAEARRIEKEKRDASRAETPN